jgi:hypothetical protein
MVKCGIDCWIDKAEEVWAVLQAMGVWSHLWRETAADGTMGTIMLAYEAEALSLSQYERLSRLVLDGDAITPYPVLDDEELRQWQEQQDESERLDGW